jgi:hypothetical protein
MDRQQAYDHLHRLLQEFGTAEDFEALDALWVSSEEELQRQALVAEQSRILRAAQGRTITGAMFNAQLRRDPS